MEFAARDLRFLIFSVGVFEHQHALSDRCIGISNWGRYIICFFTRSQGNTRLGGDCSRLYKSAVIIKSWRNERDFCLNHLKKLHPMMPFKFWVTVASKAVQVYLWGLKVAMFSSFWSSGLFLLLVLFTYTITSTFRHISRGMDPNN